MSNEKSEIVEHDKGVLEAPDKSVIVPSNPSRQQSAAGGASPQFFKLAKKFAIDGALLPENQQMLIEDRTVKRARLTQLRKQKNIENIMQKTLSYCGDFEIGQRTDLDWFSRYIALSESMCISDKRSQSEKYSINYRSLSKTRSI